MKIGYKKKKNTFFVLHNHKKYMQKHKYSVYFIHKHRIFC